MTELFSTREIAAAAWCAVFLTWAFAHRTVRSSFADLLLAAATPKIAAPVMVLVGYIIGITWVLHAIGFWTTDLLKETLIWALCSGIILPFSIVTGKYEGAVLPRLLRDSVAVIVLLEFLVATYTFSLVVELLILPVMTVIVVMNTIADGKKEYAAVAKVTSFLQTAFGLTVAVTALTKAIGGFEALGNWSTGKLLVLPVALTAALAPFTYVLLLYSNVEQLLLRLQLAHDLEPEARSYARRRILLHVRLSPHRAQRLLDRGALALISLRTRTDVDALLG